MIDGEDTIRPDGRVRMDGCENADHIRDLRAAEAMAAAIDIMIHRGLIDARSLAGDARLLYGPGDDAFSEAEAWERLRKYLPGG